MTDTPLQEKTAAELEAEARERAQAQRQADAPIAGIKTGQPEVTQLQKRGKNRLMMLGLVLLAALIIVAWMGDWAYREFMIKPAANEEQVKPAADEVSYGRKRQGMGRAENPLGLQDTAATNTPTAPLAPAPAPPMAFNKSAALAMMESAQNRSNTALASRTAERRETVTASPSAGEVATATASTGVATVTGVQRLQLNPDLFIPVDTYIPCTLQTRFISDVAGRISCLISEDVYSESTHVKLIPAGTRARGVYKTGTLNHGQSRMFVMWTELRTPDRLKIPLVDAQVVGQLGEAGIDGWVDTHFWERFGNAMMLSTVQDVAAAAANSAPSKNRNTDYTENSRAAAAEMAKTALDNSINIPPTIYKNQGDIIGIMTGSDIDFSGVYRLKLK
jgi:type IV secretion system protein VirB10